MARKKDGDGFDGTSFLALTMMYHFPHLLVDEQRSTAVDRLMKSYGIRTITRDNLTPPWVDIESRTIIVGWPFARMIWARLCGYIAIFEWWKGAGQPNSTRSFFSDPSNAPYLKAFNWALDQGASSAPIYYPPDLPRPPQPDPGPVGYKAMDALRSPELGETFEGRVTQACQRAIGWMILHESAHILLGHSRVPAIAQNEGAPQWLGEADSMVQEQEADHFASSSMLPRDPADYDSNALYQPTLFGIIGAHVSLASDVLTPAGRATRTASHTPPLTRLRRLLLTFLAKNDFAWQATSLFLELELWAQDLPSAEAEEFGTDAHLCQIHIQSGGIVASRT